VVAFPAGATLPTCFLQLCIACNAPHHISHRQRLDQHVRTLLLVTAHAAPTPVPMLSNSLNPPCLSCPHCHAFTGQQRDAWHHGRSSTSITPGARTAAEPALRPASLSAGAAAPNSTAPYTNGGNSGSSGGGSSNSLSTSRGVDRDRDRSDRSERPDRDRAVHGPWSHFHTSSRSGRTGPHGGRESASGHIGGSVDTDRFHTLGSPFKHSSSTGSSSSRHGLQRSVSDSGSTVAGAADAVHSGFGALHQQRDSRHHPTPSHSSGRQGQREGLGGAGGPAHHGGYNSGDDKMGWRDSNPRQQMVQHGPAGGAGSSRGNNKVRIPQHVFDGGTAWGTSFVLVYQLSHLHGGPDDTFFVGLRRGVATLIHVGISPPGSRLRGCLPIVNTTSCHASLSDA
jgi:hypothetical protein